MVRNEWDSRITGEEKESGRGEELEVREKR
jgi:hypothetical protein